MFLEKWFRQLNQTLVKRENGMALVMALIALALGSLMIVPTLNYTVTAFQATKIKERRTAELYAADAGIESAIWELTSNNLTLAEGQPTQLTQIQINGSAVDVTILSLTGVDATTYQITSTANSTYGTSTTIESYITSFDLVSFLDNPCTTPGEVDNKGDIEPEDGIVENYEGYWPTAEQFSEHYLQEVAGLPPAGADIDISDNATIGPLYRDGNLSIDNNGSAENATLAGTIFVTGDLVFQQPGGTGDYTLDLMGQTIYVEGSITFPPGKVTISGSGCIIAVGDILFQPGMSSDEGDFIFVMSIEGTVTMKPNGEFYGSVAGNVEIEVFPGSGLTLTQSPEGGLNIPGCGQVTVLSWQIH